MISLSGSFTVDGDVSGVLLVRPGESFTYSLANSYTGQCVVQLQGGGGLFYKTILSHTSTVSQTRVYNDSPKAWKVRIKCVNLLDATDSIAWTLADYASIIYEVNNTQGEKLLWVTSDKVFNVNSLLINGLPVTGTGDVVGPAASVDSELALFSGITGKLLKRATGSGTLYITNGVYTAVSTLTYASNTWTFTEPIVISTSSGPMASFKDGGTAGTNADPHILFQDSSTNMGELGFKTEASLNMTLGNIKNGSLLFNTNNVLVMSISNAGVVNVPGLTASRVLTTDGSKNLASSAVTTTTLGYLDATSSVQTQLDAKAPNYAETDDGNSGTADTINWTVGCAHKSTLTGNVTYTFTAPAQAGTPLVLRVLTGAGSFTATWPAAVKWAGGTAPTVTTTASKIDLFSFYYDGTSYLGSYTQNL